MPDKMSEPQHRFYCVAQADAYAHDALTSLRQAVASLTAAGIPHPALENLRTALTSCERGSALTQQLIDRFKL